MTVLSSIFILQAGPVNRDIVIPLRKGVFFEVVAFA